MGKLRHKRIFKEMGAFYESVFHDWSALYESLLQQNQHCAVLNKHCKYADNMIQSLRYESNNIVVSTHTSNSIKDHDILRPLIGTNNDICNNHLRVFTCKRFPSPQLFCQSKGAILPFYLMDLASLLPVMSLDINPTDCVLDMCASPGGKTIAISQLLSSRGQLVCNDFSKKRLIKLNKVIKEYIPEDLQRIGHVVTTNFNAEIFGTEERCTFDKVLVDVPCSSERHVVQDEFQYGGWSVNKMKENAKLQSNLLLSALQSVKPGGIVSYSTCSLSPLENEEVVIQTIDLAVKEGLKVCLVERDSHISSTVGKFDDSTFQIVDSVSHGILVVPSKITNWGPMYFAKILKNS